MQTYPFDVVEVARTVRQPPLTDLVGRAARRVRRRRALLSAAAVAMTALVAVTAVPVLRGVNLTAVPAEDGTRAGVRTATAVLDRGTVVTVRYGECAAEFSVTTDGGRTWSPYRGPVPWRDCGAPTTTSYRLLGPRVFAAEVQGARYLTRDAGESWHREEERVRTGGSVPPQAREQGDVPGQLVDPDTGTLYQPDTLAGPADGAGLLRRASDGTLWALLPGSAPGGDGQPAVPKVARSDDSGRNWRWSAPFPASVARALLVAVGPEQAYVVGDCPDGAAVYRTDDGGEAWFATYVAWESAEAATVNSGGDLLVGGWEEDGRFAAWVSRDGGRSFSRGEAITVPDGSAAGVADGRLWVAGGSGWAATSTDGRWRVTEPRRD
ncbi:sialidase family protein [Micromonospora sp. WMMD1102]|uniref:sialidase family protein n=1 Tax=Micromonospora sp. WMMD1102 TaxID=3016105 RepID=UPI0024150CA2|nr:sialidase family protein [Micromonospora sp. WMMD1102]MDG4790436.1 sialidase family protein [Micromonospora sp. WMMD1102]